MLANLGLAGSLKERSTGVLVNLCFFHSEKNPSLHFFPKSMRYKCHGCGIEGEVTDFVARHNGYKEYIHEDMMELKEFFAKLS